MNEIPEIGDVLLVHKCYSTLESEPESNCLKRPQWAVVEDLQRDSLATNIYLEWKGTAPRNAHSERMRYLAERFKDEWEIVSENDWPDEVCAWIAQRALSE